MEAVKFVLLTSPKHHGYKGVYFFSPLWSMERCHVSPERHGYKSVYFFSPLWSMEPCIMEAVKFAFC